MLTLVCATRTSVQDFHQQTLLGRCLPRLGECYNNAIDAAAECDALVFVHDDVRIDDWMLGQRLQDALKVFDVVGVAGNRRRQPGQLTWPIAITHASGGSSVQSEAWFSSHQLYLKKWRA